MSGTNWGDVTASMLTRLGELLADGVVKQVQAATEDDLAATAPKRYPAVFLIWKGAALAKAVTLVTNRFSSQFTGRWEVHHFCVTGSGDDLGMFAATGPFAVSVLTRTKLMGFYPAGQVGGVAPLICEDIGEISRFDASGGTGGMRVVAPYSLSQIVTAQ